MPPTNPLFTKKHFEFIANVIAQNSSCPTVVQWAIALQQTNPNFDANRFIKACSNDSK